MHYLTTTTTTTTTLYYPIYKITAYVIYQDCLCNLSTVTNNYVLFIAQETKTFLVFIAYFFCFRHVFHYLHKELKVQTLRQQESHLPHNVIMNKEKLSC